MGGQSLFDSTLWCAGMLGSTVVQRVVLPPHWVDPELSLGTCGFPSGSLVSSQVVDGLVRGARRLIQGVFPHHTQCSLHRLRIHVNPGLNGAAVCKILNT